MKRRSLWFGLALAVAGCGGDPAIVEPRDHDRFWLWAGAHAPENIRAREWYVLDGEVRADDGARFTPLRPAPPRLANSDVWLVVRTDTLAWPGGSAAALARRADRWKAAGSRVVGIQLDFDARTAKLGDYVAFLARFRRELPASYKLSITGLMDWSAHGDPAALARLRGTVDEVVIQTYQDRATIPGYARYFDRMDGFPIPFKVGLVERGRWIPPPMLASEPNFKGYVVFLLNRR